ncbi:MAG: ABC transporter substrate-binding protein, partial [Flavobacteriaceae bacterium]|nr:ABC transporter substrate-binding protein [Flavobacteriaceae bacterium]
VAIVILISIVLLFYFLNQSNNQDSQKVVIGISPFPDTYMPYLGKIKGWYKEEGLDVEFRVLGWTEVQEALSSGASDRIDIGINNISSIIATYDRNPELVYYYGNNTFDNGFALMIRPEGEMKPLNFFIKQGMELSDAIAATGAQLKGKTVVTTANTDMEQGVAAVAKKGGISFTKDVSIVNLNPDDGLTAFLSGTGDAFIGGIPQRNKAGEQGMIEMITGTNLGPPPINGLVTTKKFVEGNEEALLKITKVWFKIVNYTNDNLDEVAKTMTEELNRKTGSKVSVDDFKKFWNNYEHYPSSPQEIQKEILSAEGRNYWKERWDDCNDYFYNIKGTIPRPVPFEEAFYMIDAQKKLVEFLEKDDAK